MPERIQTTRPSSPRSEPTQIDCPTGGAPNTPSAAASVPLKSGRDGVCVSISVSVPAVESKGVGRHRAAGLVYERRRTARWGARGHPSGGTCTWRSLETRAAPRCERPASASNTTGDLSSLPLGGMKTSVGWVGTHHGASAPRRAPYWRTLPGRSHCWCPRWTTANCSVPRSWRRIRGLRSLTQRRGLSPSLLDETGVRGNATAPGMGSTVYALTCPWRSCSSVDRAVMAPLCARTMAGSNAVMLPAGDRPPRSPRRRRTKSSSDVEPPRTRRAAGQDRRRRRVPDVATHRGDARVDLRRTFGTSAVPFRLAPGHPAGTRRRPSPALRSRPRRRLPVRRSPRREGPRRGRPPDRHARLHCSRSELRPRLLRDARIRPGAASMLGVRARVTGRGVLARSRVTA